MTEENDVTREDAGAPPLEGDRRDETLRREVIDSWKNRYVGLYRRRWGKSPDGPSAKRILVLHDEAWGDHSLDKLRRLFGAAGARVDHSLLTGGGGELPFPGDYDVLVIAGAAPPAPEESAPLASFTAELLRWSGLVAGIAGGATFLFVERFLEGEPPGEENDIVKGEHVFACAGREGVEELAASVLDRLEVLRSWNGEEAS